MFDASDRSWLERSAPASNASAEIAFHLQDHFLTGDPNDFEQIDDPRFHASLPSFGNGQFVVTTGEALGREDELIRHYRRVVELGRSLDRPFDQYLEHFWLRFTLSWAGGTLQLPWHDTMQEIRPFLDWFCQAKDSDEHWDIEQGWELLLVRRGDRIHLRVGDGEGEEYENVHLDREPLLRSVSALNARIAPILQRLHVGLGADPWTQHRYQWEPEFGTADWRPGPGSGDSR